MHPQSPFFFTLIKGFFVFILLSFLLTSVVKSSTPFFIVSEYGAVVLLRVLVQAFLAHQNNQSIQQLVRKQIIFAIEKKEHILLLAEEKTQLLRIHDYRLFRNKLQEKYPHLSDTVIWTSIIHQTFLNLGFSSVANFPPVFIVIPIFRPESLQEVENTASSLLFQTYPAIGEILLCFNDPTNLKMSRKIHRYVLETQQKDKRLQFLSLPTASKRAAMYIGFLRHTQKLHFILKQTQLLSPFWFIQNTLIRKQKNLHFLEKRIFHPGLNSISVNIDADTQVDKDAIALGVLLLLLDKNTAAITSNVEIRNPTHNFLSLLTSARYKSANVIERAAQSSLYTVRCMSGPFMMFWTHNLLSVSPRGRSISDEWVNETFLNVKVEPGDDRSWTIRHNELGFGVRFHPDILVTTDCPMSWQRWCKQQLRWMRSCNRNFIMSLPFLFKMPLYIIFDDLYLFFFPILLIFILARLLWHSYQHVDSLSGLLYFFLPYIFIIFTIQFLRSAHLAYSQKNARFLFSSLYFLVYIRYLFWLRIISFFTITHSDWAGRTSADFAADQAVLKGGPV